VDSSTDGTDGIVEREFPGVRLLHFPERCKVGKARNLGVQAARGDIVLFTDTDTIPGANWVDQMFRALEDSGADGVGGAMSNGTPESFTGSAAFYLEFFHFIRHQGKPEPARYLVGGNSGFRKEVLNGLGYEERAPGEDMAFSSRVAGQGGKLVFLPGASVIHQNRTGFRSLLRYQYYLGGGAHMYRSLDPPMGFALLRAAPSLIFLAPFGIMFWIGTKLLRRGCIADFMRFLAVLPLCWIGNMAWALGFYEALRKERQDSGRP
jgi:GT2 family glycosyltransferase